VTKVAGPGRSEGTMVMELVVAGRGGEEGGHGRTRLRRRARQSSGEP